MKLILFYVVSILLFVNADKISKNLKDAYVDIETKSNKVILTFRKANEVIHASLYTKSTFFPYGESLRIVQDCDILTTCIQIANTRIASIKVDPETEIVNVTRHVPYSNGEIVDCFELSDDTQWYGGPEWRYQHWPIQHQYYEEEPYVTTHPENMAIAERYWLSSKGIYIYADEKAPLFLDQNNIKDKHMCLVVKNKKPYQHRDKIDFTYEIGVFKDPKIAHMNVVNKHFAKPRGRPNDRMVTHPIWSTWARYKVHVNDTVVRQFANEIVAHGFNNSQLEIDDNWETCYGSAKFDAKKFPNVPKLTSDLKKKGFRVTLWIHPFINEKCNDGEAYDYALKYGYFVKNEKNEVHTSWWQGADAAVIDFTNPKAVAWWIGRLKKLQQLGIDSFKFDAGEESWLPQTPQLTSPDELSPGIYTQKYVSALASNFDNNIEVRVGWRSQDQPIFVRMIDKDSTWTWNNGLPTLLTTLFQMNLNGYMYVLPDMIGGNGYVGNSFNNTALPSKEMFIRWLQANVFMPAMQYSFVPWDYDNETIEISKKFTNLHAKNAPKIIQLMDKAMQQGTPINTPVWWIEPHITTTHSINDEYLLGDDILVAPVLEEGARSRNIYLPNGKWRDENSQKVFTGPLELTDYKVPLDVLPYFTRIP